MNQYGSYGFDGVVAVFERKFGSLSRSDLLDIVGAYHPIVGGCASMWGGCSGVLSAGIDVYGVGSGGTSEEVGRAIRTVGSVAVGSGVPTSAPSGSAVGESSGPQVVSGVAETDVGGGCSMTAKGKHWRKNLAKRLRRKKKEATAFQASAGAGCAESSSSGMSSSCGDSGVDCSTPAFSGVGKSTLATSFEERRIAENRLATQKAEYQFKKNEYMTRSRVVEQQWETERLTCDQKLQRISEARFGSKPGFAETLVSANISSTSLPSMSQGTLSPDSSISVAEVNRMFKLIADLTAQVAQLTVESKAMKETAVLSAYEQRKLEMENMTFEQIAALRGTEKDIRPDGSPVKYDAIGQEIYSECGRPDFMNQYDYRSSITVSEDGQ